MCRVFFCVVEKGYLLWTLRSLDKILLAFVLFHFVFQGQSYLLLQVSLDFLLLHSSSLWWKGYLLLVLVLDGLVGLHRTVQFKLLWHYCLGTQIWIIVVLNGLPWKQTHIILLFLRFHLSTAFWTLVCYEGHYYMLFILKEKCPFPKNEYQFLISIRERIEFIHFLYPITWHLMCHMLRIYDAKSKSLYSRLIKVDRSQISRPSNMER